MNEEELINAISEFVDDPLGFVEFVFDWGEGELSNSDGPDTWQRDVLIEIGKGSLGREDALQMAVRSGKGIGKTSLLVWVILWFMSTRPSPQIVVTANSQAQLDTKTWRELAIWHKRMINAHWFEWTATKFMHVESPTTWYAAAIPWSRHKTQAFAGTHSPYVLMIFDEASEIDDKIWEMAEGALTANTQGTEVAIWLVFGNPSVNTGRFYECFNKFRHRWITREIDARTFKFTNKKQIENWIKDYGEDSDFVRVTVKGQEPRSGSMQLIGSDIVNAALGRSIHPSQYQHAPIIIGVDVARGGKDQTVFCVRQGLAILYLKSYRGIDTMLCASLVAALEDEWHSDAIFIDSIGIGAGVCDRLRQLNYSIIEVNSAKDAMEKSKYFNLRAEMWLKMKEWLLSGGCIPDNTELRDDLTMVTYGYDMQHRYQITKKTTCPGRPTTQRL